MLLQIQLSPFQAGILLGAGLGFILGLIPLILGIIKKRIKIGVFGFIGAIVGNAVLGLLLSIPIVGVCIYLILKKSPIAPPVDVRAADENPIDVKIDASENR